MPLVDRIRAIRDIPYRIPLTSHETDQCCTGKHRLVRRVLEDQGYAVRFRVCEFRWSALNLPMDLLRLPHEDVTQHTCLEFQVGEEWRTLDLTWDVRLMSLFPVIHWDGEKATSVAVPVDRWLSVEESEAIMSLEGEPLRLALEADLVKNGLFYAAFNAYLEGVRVARLDQPLVGIAVMVMKDGKVLMYKRKGEHGGGRYGFPGGHLEWMETIEEGARREVREEAGVEIENIRFLRLSNQFAHAPKHYVNIAVLADWKAGEPVTREPERMESGWEWYEPSALPTPLFQTVPSIINAYFGKSWSLSECV